MKPIQYRFIIRYGENLEREVHPTYKNDLSLDYELESNQQFFRKKLSGKIAFIREDYDFLNKQEFDTEFIMLMYESKDGGKTWKEIFRGKFMKTDCTWNDYDKKCDVSPSVYDEYNDVIAGLEKEYNLIKLRPEVRRLTIKKRLMIQVYLPGDSVVSCFLGGTYWEQDVIEPTTDDTQLVNKYHFANASKKQEIIVKQAPYADMVNQAYIGAVKGELSGSTKYRMKYFEHTEDSTDEEGFYYVQKTNGLRLYVGDRLGWEFSQTQTWNYDPIEYKDLPNTATLKAISPEIEDVLVDINIIGLYLRYVCDVEEIGGVKTYDIPTDDLVENNRNYKRCVGYAINAIYVNSGYSEEPTEYGVRPDGTYYTQPYTIWGERFYPVARSTWNYASYWFRFSVVDKTMEEESRSEFELRDTYPIHSVIKVLLAQFSDIRHEGTSNYSKFLYGAENPITNQKFHLLLSPKSNVLHGNYDKPAMKAQATLGTILNMLRNVYKCYWYIEDGKLKIEHISFFMNGGTYDSTPVIGTDLTKIEVLRSGKKWGFSTSSYEFDKSDMPERYQFGWMDNVTEAFDGYPIEVQSNYVSKGQIEEITVTGFTTDIDYMLLNPGAISQDGFALFAAIFTNNRYELPFVERNVDGAELRIQNGYLSWITLHPNYYTYDLPAKDVLINNSKAIVNGTRKTKKQQVKFPSSNILETTKLIKTYIGNGQIEKLSLNLSSRINQVTLKYDTE